MKKIGLISDTHGYWDERYKKHFEPCDEIWHAGDIGSLEIAERFSKFRPFRAVCGNCDGGELRRMYPQILRWRCQEADVLMKHTGGYPGNYDSSIRAQIFINPPQLFISGHSHILKIKYDRTLSLLHINPGAAGLEGWQKQRTLIRFIVDKKEFKDMEIIELAE